MAGLCRGWRTVPGVWGRAVGQTVIRVDACSAEPSEVFSFRANVFSFAPNVFSFAADVFSFRGQCVQFSA